MTKYIQRHSALSRFTHNTVAVTCIVLALTGAVVMFQTFNNAAGAELSVAMRWIHRIMAVFFMIVPIFAMLWSPKGCRHLFSQNIFGKWDKDDADFTMKFVPYMFAPSKVHMPPQREVKSGQRVADGALVFLCIGLGITGLVMWLDTGLLPGGEMKFAIPHGLVFFCRILHDICFILMIVLGLAHIYLGAGIFQPYRGTARLMWGDGKVKEADAAYHWGYWAAEEIASGRNVTVVEDGKK